MHQERNVLALVFLGFFGLFFCLNADVSGTSTEDLYGKINTSSRYRYEYVNDDRLSPALQKLSNANASTLRTNLGYSSIERFGIALQLDVEHVMSVGNNDFNDGSNGKTSFAPVVDPSGLELDQAYLSFKTISKTEFKIGRQYLRYRNAPFHRYMGTVLWRQNWQTQDALSVVNKSLADTTINYAYSWKINRIFGSDAPEPLSHFSSNSHLLNLQYKGLSTGKIEIYAYLLDLDNAAVFSTQTYGARFNGKYKFKDSLDFLYAIEYAHQSDFNNNPAKISAAYNLAEFGLSKKFTSLINSVSLKMTYEKLAGDGGADRFVTILGTNHAFQGWADRFLITPGDGIEDLIVTVVVKFKGTTLIAAHHQLNSDNLGYDYGNEIDLLVSRKFNKYLTLGMKYSNYAADRNNQNILRNGSNSGVANDVSKFWLWLQAKF